MESMTPVKKDLLNKAVYEYEYAVYVLQKELLTDLGTISRTDYIEFFYDNEEIFDRLLAIGSGVDEFDYLVQDLKVINDFKAKLYNDSDYNSYNFTNYEHLNIALIMFSICLVLEELNISDPFHELYRNSFVQPTVDLSEILDLAVNYYDNELPLAYSKVKAYVQDIFL